MDTLIQKFFEKNIKKTWDGCSYDLDNPTEEFYYNLKTSLDDLKHGEKKEREPSEFFKAIYQDPKNQKTASYNTKEIYIKNDKKSIDSIKESDNIDLFKTVLMVKNESKTSKKKSLVEAFSEEELDMDEDEWLAKMKAQRAEEIRARQEKRDAEEKAKKEAEEKAARLARGELTKDEKRANIKINCKHLQKYIDSMENDLKDTFQKLMGNQTLHFGNPIGFEPRGGDMVYDFSTFPMWTEIKTPFGEDETNNQLSSDFCYTTEYGKYPACIVYYPTISLESLTFQMTGDPVEADMFHSGSRNKKDWKVYFVDGLKTLESEEQIHDIFDSDAELFACVKWIMYEQFGVMVAASCINSTKTIADACKAFGETPYAQESMMGNNAWFFGQFLTGLVSEEQQAEIMR